MKTRWIWMLACCFWACSGNSLDSGLSPAGQRNVTAYTDEEAP